MRERIRYCFLIGIIALIFGLPGAEALGARIKDIATIQGVESRQLVGYGIVVGLDGTGDGASSRFTVQSVSNMLERFGISVSPNEIKLKNVASVIVTATLPPFTKKGGTIDVIVSSLGDAVSLEGGILLLTPLATKEGIVCAHAQGSVSFGGFNFQAGGGEKIRKNYTLVGRVPNGAIVDKEFIGKTLQGDWQWCVSLKNPDFTSALRLTQAINGAFAGQVAMAEDAATIRITTPQEYRSAQKIVAFISAVEGLTFVPDVAARVVLNERTGTIVSGEKVGISASAIAHGNIVVEISSSPVISQPAPFAKQGETVSTEETAINIIVEDTRMVPLQEASNVQEVATALNALGVTPRDMIAIFQALKEARALHAELVIM